ncbi:two-component system sensor histidine kinase BaeS [Proteus hauseri]|uniref:histidine kinase n=1 Tax=Proteus cibi TaxID=2050966 RepID=A0ABU6ED97_9GAMM|nr:MULTISPECIES: two-component system sensor histidine kinase BaeS [Proteus]MBG6032352.1 two-component system sensor histidine kinase BaeS [Proteus hauseri]MBS6209373.1 two-component system sensor histidine kinase BaeS [Proteus hauseri]MEB6855985.1 two-component system sensor histidine kinase BaeS [Proteus cibi]MEB7088022.1 two-component system sensor histidine kinase BaeS [Proteus cibi]
MKLRSKLFLVVFATCMVVVLAMHIGIRGSFQQGFIGYIKKNSEQRATLLAEALTEQYALTGDWRFLNRDDRSLYQILRSIDQISQSSEGPPPRGWRTQFWIVDKEMKRLFGHDNQFPAETFKKPITFHNDIVGWVIVSAADKISNEADISFDKQQLRTSWIIAGLTVLFALLITLILSRNMIRPVKRLVEATHKLAAGDFSVRVTPTSKDEISQLATDFNQLASTLEKNEQIRRDYMADISHELRTPLAILKGELEALQDGVRKPTTETLNSLLFEVTNLTKLVNDLHQLSLSDRGSLTYRKDFIDINEVILLAVASYRHTYQTKDITLLTELDDLSPLIVQADPDRLIQLFHNLLENSVRYTYSGGQLHISTKKEHHHVLISLEDSAPGLDSAQYDVVFQRFYRAENSRNRASGGSGLGLAICENIVEAHNGKISAMPSSLGGMKILIELPAYFDDL